MLLVLTKAGLLFLLGHIVFVAVVAILFAAG